MNATRWIARRPVLDVSLQTMWYDLLVDGHDGLGGGPEVAVATILIDSITSPDLDVLLEGKHGSIVAPLSLLVDGTLVGLEVDSLGFELGPEINIGAEVAGLVGDLTSQGIRITVADRHFEAVREFGLAPAAARISGLGISAEGLKIRVQLWHRYNIPVVVDGIRDQVQFHVASRLGVDFVSGPFLAVPKLVARHRIPASRTQTMRLLAELHSPDSSMTRIAEIVEGDVSLSYRLLRVLNSAFYGLNRSVSSIKEAVILLGPRQIASWASLIKLSGLDDTPNELLKTAMIRGKMCEELAPASGAFSKGQYFIVGSFSVLDSLLNVPLDELVDELPFDGDVVAALLRRSGPLGEALSIVVAYEQGRWDDLARLNPEPTSVRQAYLQAIEWTAEIGAALVG